ncbi:hypothetical protein M569_12420 [Genlisea aurea]|uniref:Uncharacterized protein n=1 Tax=Genlisea aurea TaxID=192259 RepID=S8CD67_9LAMI|nr:hypothetical protein M569_12420 [Genlisea aurea]
MEKPAIRPGIWFGGFAAALVLGLFIDQKPRAIFWLLFAVIYSRGWTWWLVVRIAESDDLQGSILAAYAMQA